MRLCFLVALVVPVAQAFSPTFGVAKHSARPLSSLFERKFTSNDIIGKEFQLEEREDQDTEISEIWLNADGTVNIGETHGPPVENFWGVWTLRQDGDKPFRMEVIRTYTGGSHTGKNQVGEFSYDVKREFWGDVGMIGDVVAVTGTIHGDDEASQLDCEVGYFSLIDEAAEDMKVA